MTLVALVLTSACAFLSVYVKGGSYVRKDRTLLALLVRILYPMTMRNHTRKVSLCCQYLSSYVMYDTLEVTHTQSLTPYMWQSSRGSTCAILHAQPRVLHVCPST